MLSALNARPASIPDRYSGHLRYCKDDPVFVTTLESDITALHGRLSQGDVEMMLKRLCIFKFHVRIPNPVRIPPCGRCFAKLVMSEGQERGLKRPAPGPAASPAAEVSTSIPAFQHLVHKYQLTASWPAFEREGLTTMGSLANCVDYTEGHPDAAELRQVAEELFEGGLTRGQWGNFRQLFHEAAECAASGGSRSRSSGTTKTKILMPCLLCVHSTCLPPSVRRDKSQRDKTQETRAKGTTVKD